MAIGLVFAAQSWATGRLGTGGSMTEGGVVAAKLITVSLLGGLIVLSVVWREWFHNIFSRLPRRRVSLSMGRHMRNRLNMARGFRTWVRSSAGGLSDPPKPAEHDDAFLEAWTGGDLEACEKRLTDMAGEVDRRQDEGTSRLLHYQRCLERGRRTVAAMVRTDNRTGSILDEDD